jgi:hypothetical protein
MAEIQFRKIDSVPVGEPVSKYGSFHLFKDKDGNYFIVDMFKLVCGTGSLKDLLDAYPGFGDVAHTLNAELDTFVKKQFKELLKRKEILQ